MPDLKHDFLTSPASLDQFLAAWESGTLPKPHWTHAAHVAVGAYYTVRFGKDAFTHMRAGIRRYNESVGTLNSPASGYHETLTRFWSLVIAKALAGETAPWVAASKAVALFGEERTLHTRYYSFDVVRNTIARQSWVPPDLQEI